MRKKPLNIKERNTMKIENDLPPNESANFPERVMVSAPKREGQNFNQNRLLPKKWVVQASRDSSGGTSMNPQAK